MKPNIGRVDALCRISLGFTVLAWSTAKLVRKPSHNLPLFAAMIGGMKVAEGITRFCPLVYMAEHKMVAVQAHASHDRSCHHDENQQNHVVN
ncbi:YgaP family membrane protein [Halalkalibacter lacteus]|uniref:YgaP family membrane protein n=1 Tax=Halalkalibacter lacteus TaxID=3090663 RepID=UPI002FCBADC8